MSLPNLSSAEHLARTHVLPETYADFAHANTSVVSWAAILSGATAAAALSLILLMLGMGLGLSSVSPWAHRGITATSFGISTIIWITVTQILASGLGGYLAGRLRTKWAGAHTDEVYFRDTAHGFLSWAVATLATAALLSSAIGTIVTGAAQAGASLTGSVATAVMAGGAATAGAEIEKYQNDNESKDNTMGYFTDALFRQDSNAPSAASPGPTDTIKNAAALGEVTRIFVHSIGMKALPAADASYLGRLVSNHTGLAHQAAEKRVNEIFASMQAKITEAEVMAKDAADKARKATIYGTLWIFVSLLMGAFSASLAATCGGRSRDA